MPKKKSSKRTSTKSTSSGKDKKTDEVKAEDFEEQKTTSMQQEDWGGRIVWALFLIFIGIILLLNTTGVVSWDVWGVLWKFWPVFIILGAVRIILGKTPFASLISGILAFIIFLAVFFVSLVATNVKVFEDMNITVPNWWRNFSENFVQSVGESKTSEYVIEKSKYEKLDERELSFDFGAGTFNVSDDASNEDYYYLDAKYFENFGEPEIEEDLDGNDLKIDFKQKSGFGINVPSDGPNYDFVLGQTTLPAKIYIDLGAGSGKVLLDELITRYIETDTGAGKIEIMLGESSIPEDGLKCNVGAGTTILTLSKDIGLMINYNVGVGKLSIYDEEISGLGKDGEYKSENYDDAEVTLDLEVDIGVGSFEIVDN